MTEKIKKPPRGGERKYITMRKFLRKLGEGLISLWDGIRFAAILWKGGDSDGRDENGL